MSESVLFHEGNRRLKYRFDSRRISDRLEEKLTRREFTADDAILVRDYSSVTGSAEPFYLLTTPTIFPPEHWTQTMVDGLKEKDLSGKRGFEMGTGKSRRSQ